MPQVPSVLTVPVWVGAVEVVTEVAVEVEAAVDVLAPGPELGPVRYQFSFGSPRHSPTVTAR